MRSKGTTYSVKPHELTTVEVMKDIMKNGATVIAIEPGAAISKERLEAARQLRVAKGNVAKHLNHRTFAIQKHCPWLADFNMVIIRLRQAGIIDIKYFRVGKKSVHELNDVILCDSV